MNDENISIPKYIKEIIINDHIIISMDNLNSNIIENFKNK